MTSWDSAVLGMGETGVSCTRYLSACGERVLALDSRLNPPFLGEIQALPNVDCDLGGFPRAKLQRAAKLVFSPGVDPTREEFQAPELAGIPVTGDIQLFANARGKLPDPGMLIAITGTNGKSTVALLVAHLLGGVGYKTVLGGNSWEAALNLLAVGGVDRWVLELSSFQLQLVDLLRADFALILNIAADHLDRHSDQDTYLAAKRKIFGGAGGCVFNRNDRYTYPPEDFPGMRIGVGEGTPRAGEFGCEFGMTDEAGQTLLRHQSGWSCPASALPIQGRHNHLNALFALAVAHAAGFPLARFSSVVGNFIPLAHRCQIFAAKDGVTYVDDSKATNVAAARTALLSLAPAPGRRAILLLAGGLGKGGDFGALAAAAAGRVRYAALFGRARRAIATAMDSSLVPYSCHSDMAAAFATLAGMSVPGDTLLLSPACASQDQFRDYRARGDAFRQMVGQYLRGMTP